MTEIRTEIQKERKAAYDAERKQLELNVMEAERRLKAAEAFINQFHRRRYRPYEHGRYGVMVEFDPHLVIGNDRSSREVFAEHIGRQVTAEIARHAYCETPEMRRWRQEPSVPFAPRFEELPL